MAKLSAYVLCRNEEYWLPMSLASIESVCDSIFLIDNGSEDRSVEIAEEFGCEIIQMPGTGFDDPKSREQDLRDRGIRACLEDGADFILRIDADEVLYENQENVIRDIVRDGSIGAWQFQCHRFVSDHSWVQELRKGESGFMESGSYDLVGFGRQTGQGKMMLFRANPKMRYVVDPHYLGLHSSEFNSVVPHSCRTVNVWYTHSEWCRSNRRLYHKACMYYSLVSDRDDFCHTREFLDQVNPENVFYPFGKIYEYQRIRPFGLRRMEKGLPIYMEGFKLPVETVVAEDGDGRLYVEERRWYGDSAI